MEQNKIGNFMYNNTSDRWCLNFNDYYVELHCGDCFLIKLKDKQWREVRIEIGDDKWYLITSIGDISIPTYPCKVKEIK